MTTKTLQALGFTLLLATAAFAHGWAPSGVDPDASFTVSGPVLAYEASGGHGTPYLTVDDPVLGAVDLGLGPIWYLAEAGFSAAVGDHVSALVYPCSQCSFENVVANISNLDNGSSVTLRDEDGRPTWLDDDMGNGGGGNGNGDDDGHGGGGHCGGGSNGGGSNGGGHQGGGQGGGSNGGGHGHGGHYGGYLVPDVSRIATVTGHVVDAPDWGTGMGEPPTLDFATADGDLELYVMPLYPLLASGLDLEAGLELQVTWAPAAENDGEEIAVVITIVDPATGLTIRFRDPETGLPLAGTCGGY